MVKKALGRGLGALMPNVSPERDGGIVQINVKKIKPNRYQPRRFLDDEKIEELVASIKEQGVIQPIVVRVAGDGYELIIGERRLRAVEKAGMDVVPAIIRDVSNAEMLELALVENLQRENLNPIDEAEAYQNLIEEFGLTQDEVAQRVGKDRSTVSNMLRLLKLPDDVKRCISQGTVSTGHAKAILSLSNPSSQVELCKKIVKEGLSVRRSERLAKEIASPHRKLDKVSEDPIITALEERLRYVLGTKVKVSINRRNRGKIEIEFYSQEDLNRIIETLEK